MAKNRSALYRTAALQVNAGSDWRKNFIRLQQQISKALRYKPQLIALPENFLWRGPSRDISAVIAQSFRSVTESFSSLARKHRCAFLLGSLLESKSGSSKCYNTSLLFDEKGRLAARYRKIHLFDVNLKEIRVQESKHVASGKQVITANLGKVRAGFSVCYDLRFPELYRELSRRNAEILFVPANFTKKTGKDHWEILLRARAIENLAYVVAPGQVGVSPSNGIESFGHSMIVDPWGKVLVEADGKSEEVICADLDLGYLREIRRIFPALKHRYLA